MKAQDFIGDPQEAAVSLGAGLAVRDTVYGARAMRLARILGLGLPMPRGYALSFAAVRALGEGAALPELPGLIHPGGLLALRSSPQERGWGESRALLDIGISDLTLAAVAARMGAARALAVYRRFVPCFAFMVHGIAPEDFRDAPGTEPRSAIDAMLVQYREETGSAFPQEPSRQLGEAARAMALAWERSAARLLRQARGARPRPVWDSWYRKWCRFAILSARPGIASRDGGHPGGEQQHRRSGSAGRFSPAGGFAALGLDSLPAPVLDSLSGMVGTLSAALGDAFTVDFAVSGEGVAILDATPVPRGARAAVRIAVDLARAGIITREQALLRVEPRSLIEHLHPQIDPKAPRDVFGHGLAASPGAATGRIVFDAEAAQAAAARDEATILVRSETTPKTSAACMRPVAC